jgi:hypothetical protein
MQAGFVRVFGGASIVAAAVSIFSANAEAAPIPVLPPAEYYNVANMSLPNNLDFGDGGSGFTSAHLSPDPGYPASWASDYSTSNNFSIPRVSATAQAGSGKGEANSVLTYYLMFAGTPGDVSVHVQASGGASAQGTNDLNGYGHNEASATLFMHLYSGGTTTGPDLLNQAANSNYRNGSGPGLQTFSVNQDMTFTANLVYQVVMSAYASAVGDETSTAYVDPFFTAPAGYSIYTSSGIGNLAAVTPIPAALPLFTSGLGALGLVGWRKRRKAALRAA